MGNRIKRSSTLPACQTTWLLLLSTQQQAEPDATHFSPGGAESPPLGPLEALPGRDSRTDTQHYTVAATPGRISGGSVHAHCRAAAAARLALLTAVVAAASVPAARSFAPTVAAAAAATEASCNYAVFRIACCMVVSVVAAGDGTAGCAEHNTVAAAAAAAEVATDFAALPASASTVAVAATVSSAHRSLA